MCSFIRCVGDRAVEHHLAGAHPHDLDVARVDVVVLGQLLAHVLEDALIAAVVVLGTLTAVTGLIGGAVEPPVFVRDMRQRHRVVLHGATR